MTSPIVQSNVGDGDGIVSVVPYTQPQTKGNCNVVFFAWDDTTALIAGTPTDTLGNTYQLLVQSTLNDLSLYVYVAYNIQAAAANANSVTAQTNVAPSFPELYIAEVPAAYVDSMTVAIASAATGVLASAGPVTPARNNETLLAYCYNDNTATGPGAGWTLDSNSISGYGAVLEYMTATLAGGPPVTATTPLGSPTKWVQVILGFYMPDENFQDIVVLSGDTLNHEGAMFNIGTSTASTVYAGFSNSAAQLVLAATQTVDATLWLPDVNGTLAVESQLGPAGLAAGTQTATSGTVVFSNSNGVTFGMNGSSVVTASVNAAGGGVALNAGTQTATSGTVVFSNSNNVSFGMSGSTRVTASAEINVSAGTTSNNLSALTFSNSNGISFGLNGSVITASAAGGGGGIAAAAGTQTATSGTVVFSNSNNVSFGMSNSSVVTAAADINVSAGTTSNNLSALTFSNSNGVSFGLNGSVLTASAGQTTISVVNFSAGTTSQNLQSVVFSNANGVSFGLNGGTITGAFGGFSNWQNGAPVTSFNSSNGFLYLQPILVDQDITVTNLIFLASLSVGTANSASSGAISVNVGLYTLNGGSSGTMSLASSASSRLSWTSGGAYSSSSAIGYRQISIASWALTPGPYLFGIAVASSNVAQTVDLYGTASLVSIASGFGTGVSSMPWLPGFSVASVTICPASIAVTNTASWVRTGSSVNFQPWISFQGT